jgi:hypothetical protein
MRTVSKLKANVDSAKVEWALADFSKQASSSLLLAFASMVILGVEPHRDP